VARAFLAAIGNRETHGRSYTLAAFEWLTWRDHYRAVARSIGAPQPNFVEIPSVLLHEFVRGLGWGPFENFQYNNIFDQAASQQDLGFEQTISWEEGAGRMVQWLEAHGELRRAEEEPEYQRVLDAWESARSAFGEAMAEPA
jgi:nucleoside-diphosphate-sugar epimerase